jgi:hypothetical protein
MLNIYEQKTGAFANPEFNLLNLGKSVWKQSFQRIVDRSYPPYVRDYIEMMGVTDEELIQQFELVVDLVEGLLERKFDKERLENENWLDTGMRVVNWDSRFNWRAMAVFDMIANQGMIALWFMSIVEHFQQPDIEAQDPGSLRGLIDAKISEAEKITEKLHSCTAGNCTAE